MVLAVGVPHARVMEKSEMFGVEVLRAGTKVRLESGAPEALADASDER